MVIASELELFNILKQKLGEKEAESLVAFVDIKLKENNEANLKILATKEDIALLRGELRGEMSKLESSLLVKISEIQASTLKWVIGLVVGLYVAITGTMIAIINLAIHANH